MRGTDAGLACLAIAGGVLAVGLGIIIAVGAGLFLRRRQRRGCAASIEPPSVVNEVSARPGHAPTAPETERLAAVPPNAGVCQVDASLTTVVPERVSDQEPNRLSSPEVSAAADLLPLELHQHTLPLPEERWLSELDSGAPSVQDSSARMDEAAQPRRLDPRKRGGGRFGAGGAGPHRRETFPPPGLVCYRREQHWVLAVDVPALPTRGAIEVRQAASPLDLDSYGGSCYVVTAFGDIAVSWEQNSTSLSHVLPLEPEQCLLFKLLGGERGYGRQVHQPTYGWYLALAPRSWERDESIAGPALVEPQPVSLDGYLAHLFVVERGAEAAIAFRKPGGDRLCLRSQRTPVELVGACIDAEDGLGGPLFVQEPPRMRASTLVVWQETKVVVLGQEGEGRNKWRAWFAPDAKELEQDLGPHLCDKEDGWFFVRLYDHQDRLTTSLDFRFLRKVRAVHLEYDHVPPASGYMPVLATLYHDPACLVYPEGGGQPQLLARSHGETTDIVVPPLPECDETHWRIQWPGGVAPLRVRLERIWWALGEEWNEPSTWTDKPQQLNRSDLAATSQKALWIKLPRESWLERNTVLAGIGGPLVGHYRVGADRRLVSIPLRSFSDIPERDRPGAADLCVSFMHEGVRHDVTPCRLIVVLGCRLCEYASDSEEDMVAHISREHVQLLFPPLKYAELAAALPDLKLPERIYKCAYCDFYVSSDDPAHPTGCIIRHIKNDCTKAPRDGGPVRIKFRAIEDVSEVRKNLLGHLPYVHRCKFCGQVIRGAERDRLVWHVLEHHRNQVVELR